MIASGRGVIAPACFAVSLSQANGRQSNPSNVLGSLAVEYYPNEIDILDLDYAFEPGCHSGQMGYYVYALDVDERCIVAALTCPDRHTAKWVFENARRRMEPRYIDEGYQYGFIGTDSQVDIVYEGSMGQHDCFSKEEFDLAARRTRKTMISDAKAMRGIGSGLYSFILLANT